MAEGWRIVREEHVATAFTGEGAAKFGGRWNSKGVRVAYASSTLALATLETLVHLNPQESFRYKLFHIEFDERLALQHSGSLPDDWQAQPAFPSTKRIGDEWARKLLSPILLVPSAIIPQELNLLLNPLHPHFRKIRIGKPVDFTFDSRLL
jgi:RES domain-containing protein